ncbi:ankyrin repeat protein-like protein [Pseudovirgaria hyperparasitica]|uniref:Ankyrin repeat protein-like protein n=1 Tax=Pseudovirgaria hyperparasitica TaxID=470096 RepID=A0A6A6W4M0_9PEZI|nr:ankyrin repeat protein-like protein [Pseudovirgaria hyperparasitica]KAF2757878.1 ankyrin repeat protein-like protein [Pseudovirgaria hyperparasitica]
MADEGASPRELIFEACRRDNTTLLEEVLSDLSKGAPKGKDTEYIAKTLNEARNGVGKGALHVAAECGSYEILDILLDQEGLEIDEIDRMEQDTPLHKAVRYVNSLAPKQWEEGQSVVDILIDAGCDPRIRNKAKLKPFELVDPRNDALRTSLQKAEYAMNVGNDVVADDDDDGPTGSASDSD